MEKDNLRPFKKEQRNFLKDFIEKNKFEVKIFLIKGRRHPHAFINIKRECYLKHVKLEFEFVNTLEEERIELNNEIITEEELLNKLKNR